jgi:hypothetical protein
MASSGSVVGAQLDAQSQSPCSLGEQISVGKAYELARQLATCNREAKLRPYAGRLTGSQRYARKRRTQSLYST